MFISTNQLIKKYGIDNKIAGFFVEREPPADNLYWHEKLLYLRPAPGYLFIPLIVDLLYKIGIKREDLLSENFVSCDGTDRAYQCAGRNNKITGSEAIIRCT